MSELAPKLMLKPASSIPDNMICIELFCWYISFSPSYLLIRFCLACGAECVYKKLLDMLAFLPAGRDRVQIVNSDLFSDNLIFPPDFRVKIPETFRWFSTLDIPLHEIKHLAILLYMFHSLGSLWDEFSNVTDFLLKINLEVKFVCLVSLSLIPFWNMLLPYNYYAVHFYFNKINVFIVCK